MGERLFGRLLAATSGWLRAASVGLVTAAALLLPASASANRTFDSHIAGFEHPQSLSIDTAGHLFVSDSGKLFKYDSYPSQTLLEVVEAAVGSFAIDEATGQNFSAGGCGQIVVLNASGVQQEVWEGFDGDRYCDRSANVSVDNTNTVSKGRVYVSLPTPELPHEPPIVGRVEAYDAGRRPVDFPAEASYIEGNALTGTPSGPFGAVGPVAVGPQGEIYLIDTGLNVVDEFDSTGTFVRAFSAAGSLASFTPRAVTVDPSSGEVLVADGNEAVDEFDSSGNYLGQITEDPGGFRNHLSLEGGSLAVNSDGYLYVPSSRHGNGSEGVVDIYTPSSVVPKVLYRPITSPSATSGTVNAEVEPNGAGSVTKCKFEYVEAAHFNTTVPNPYSEGPAAIPCGGTPYATPTAVSAELSSLTTGTTYHYRVVVENAAGGIKYGADQTYTPTAVAGLDTEEATGVSESAATLNASFSGDGKGNTHYFFEWGRTRAYGSQTPDEIAGSNTTKESVSAHLSDLSPYTTYHYRVVAGSSHGEDHYLTTTPGTPSVSEAVSGVHSDVAVLEGRINPNGAPTADHFEYVASEEYELSQWDNATSVASSEPEVGMGKQFRAVSASLSGLNFNKTYYYRLVAANAFGSAAPVRTFTTLPFTGQINDPCPNSHVRQQTGAAQLLDCRAYELVSDSNTAGYDVESNIVPGQAPFADYPQAHDQVLYGVHDGAIPGVGYPTNRGVDPYLATRGANGWSTEYVGIPSNATPSSSPFASSLLEADAGLDTFVFGGPEICSPCFADGSTGVPLRLPNGTLSQGMAGSLNPPPTTEPAGYIAKHLSANGTHLLFGSMARFDPSGEDGSISIYDRNLTSGETHVVSTSPSGGNLKCELNCQTDGIGVLDVSSDGSHVLLGQLVSTSQGTRRWRLYMNVDDASRTVELTPGASEGVLFDGMTEDGSTVFFSSSQHLTGEDTSHSGADIFAAELTGESAKLSLISTGSDGAGNSSTCHPVSTSTHIHWNTLGTEEDCGDIAIGGGGGVASVDGTIYFLSPEKLDGSGHGIADAPNLYVARPGDGYVPHFVATLESTVNAPLPPKVHRFQHSFGSFAYPTGTAISEAEGEEGDTYVLNVSREFEFTGDLRKFDPSGNPVSGFGKQGKIEGQSATGTGTLQGGSNTIELVTATTGAFAVGQQISGSGIPPSTSITAVSAGSLEISEPATSGGPVALKAKRPFEEYGYAGLPTGIAVDNDRESPSYRDVYVPDFLHGVVDKFAPSGDFISAISVSLPSAVAVDQANGDLYVGEIFGGISVYDAEGAPITSIESISNPTGVAVDESGTVYVVNGGGLFNREGVLERYRPSSTSPLEYGNPGKQVSGKQTVGVTTDPEGHVYADEGEQVSEFDAAGNQIGSPIGQGVLSHSVGLGASANALVISSPGTEQVAAFSSQYPPTPQTDNPLVVDSVSEPETRHTGDFQANPSGSDAVFTSTLALAGHGEETAGHPEVYRYSASTESLDCVSCTPSGAPSAGDAGLAPNGLSLTDEGRVFFTTSDQLAVADTDNKQDVYEWEPSGTDNCEESSLSFSKSTGACLALISTGTSAFESGLLGADANGQNVYFFTRDSLVPQDNNGPTVKIYDAREGGGFPFVPLQPPCRASDECHGASSPTPPRLDVGSESGISTRSSKEPSECRKGFVLRRGRCVRRHRPKHHRRASHRRRGAKR